MTETAAPNAQKAKGRSVWPWTLVGIVVAAVWTGAGVFRDMAEAPRADGTPEGYGALIGFIVGSAAGHALVAVVVTWLIIHLVFLRSWISTDKSAIAAIIVYCAAVALQALPFIIFSLR